MVGNIDQRRRSVRLFVARQTALDHRWRVRAQFLKIVTVEERRRADDVAAESDCRCLLQRQKVRADNVGDVGARVQELVHLDVVILVIVAHVLIVVWFGEEARRSEDHARQSGVPVE